MTAVQERELIQLYQDADETGKALISDLILCFVYCGDDFIREILAVQGDKAAMRAVLPKWVATISPKP